MDYHDRLQTRPFEIGKSLLPFPEPEDVFADPVDRHAKHLDPMASIDLSIISPDLTGWVHLVSPTEPYVVGEYTKAFHNEYVSENWIAFKVIDNRYQFLGDFRFFCIENDDLPDVDPNFYTDFKALRPKQHASYTERKQRCHFRGWDSLRSGGTYPDDREGPLDQFKDRAWSANWDVYPPPPAAFKVTNSSSDDLKHCWAGVSTANGRELTFIASIDGGKYRDDGVYGPSETLLFYDPVESIAVQTFDWT